MGQSGSVGMKGDYIASVHHKEDERLEFKDRVFSVALSKDGQLLASAGLDSIVLWKVASAKRQTTFRSKRGPFYSVALSSDGSVLAAGLHGSADVLLWQSTKSDMPTALKGHSDRVYCVAFTPDGKHILSGSADMTIKTWTASGELEGTMEGHEGDVLCLVVANDGSICVSGSADRTIKIWDLVKRVHGSTLSGHTDEVRCIAISPDGLNIVSGSSDETMKLWHRRTGQLKGELNAGQGEVCCMQFSADGQLLISGGSDGTIKVWNFARGMLLTAYRGHEDQVSGMVACPLGPSLVKLISCSWDETLKFWSLPNADGSSPAGLAPPRRSSVTGEPPSIATNDKGKQPMPDEVPQVRPPTVASSQVPQAVETGSNSIAPQLRPNLVPSSAKTPSGTSVSRVSTTAPAKVS